MDSDQMQGPIPQEGSPLNDGSYSHSYVDNDTRFLLVEPPDLSNDMSGRLKIGGQDYHETHSKAKLKCIVKKAEQHPLQETCPEWSDTTPRVLIRAQAHIKAAKYAVHVANDVLPGPRFIIYCDGSIKLFGNSGAKAAGIGLAFKPLNMSNGKAASNWIEAAYGVNGTDKSEIAETIALQRSLWISRYHMEHILQKSDNETPIRVIVFSDCLSAIQNVREYCYWRMTGSQETFQMKGVMEECPIELFHQLYHCINRLVAIGTVVEINWVPGHAGINGNVRADRLANIGAKYMSVLKQTNAALPYTGLPYTLHPIQARNSSIIQTLPGIHLGKALTDLFYWMNDRTISMIAKTHKALMGKTRKRKADYIEADDDNVVALKPPLKKRKLNNEDPISKGVGTYQHSIKPIAGLICWK
ncbi:hypothetical protein ABKA04_004756 [Annulohypoxylon sp. FPYF3050]